MTVEGHQDKSFSEKVNNADLVLADGKPIASACKILYHKKQERISGMDFTPAILKKINEAKLSVFIYGSTDEVIEAMKKKFASHYPGIRFVGAESPPFRKLNDEEIRKDVDTINRSGAHLVLVSLGCPKQEKWMAEHYQKINAVLLGIGGALPVAAGIQKRAPMWMQNAALEWFYRLIQQPKRLFGRYLYTNSYFLFLLSREWTKTIFKKNADQGK
jgi:N-acetylglucosaminyldiphosphoundecaprenol N-acetyl-beta-D-mannosaminyltransferase